MSLSEWIPCSLRPYHMGPFWWEFSFSPLSAWKSTKSKPWHMGQEISKATRFSPNLLAKFKRYQAFILLTPVWQTMYFSALENGLDRADVHFRGSSILDIWFKISLFVPSPASSDCGGQGLVSRVLVDLPNYKLVVSEELLTRQREREIWRKVKKEKWGIALTNVFPSRMAKANKQKKNTNSTQARKADESKKEQPIFTKHDCNSNFPHGVRFCCISCNWYNTSECYRWNYCCSHAYAICFSFCQGRS